MKDLKLLWRGYLLSKGSDGHHGHPSEGVRFLVSLAIFTLAYFTLTWLVFLALVPVVGYGFLLGLSTATGALVIYDKENPREDR